LFTPFFTTKPEGMGLGLSLCRTVVEQHGGYLGHRANSPHGTVFSFTLAVAIDGRLADADTPLMAAPSPAARPPATSSA
jgi:signal transduction histidine kinase